MSLSGTFSIPKGAVPLPGRAVLKNSHTAGFFPPLGESAEGFGVFHPGGASLFWHQQPRSWRDPIRVRSPGGFFPQQPRLYGPHFGRNFSFRGGGPDSALWGFRFLSREPGSSSPLLHFDLREERYSAVTGREEYWQNGWELVDFLPREGCWLEQWKKSDADGISFQYRRYSPASDYSEREEILGEESFRRFYQPLSFEKAPRGVKAGWNHLEASEEPEIIRELVFPRNSETVDVVRLPGPLPGEARGYLRLPSVFEEGELTVLFPREGLLRSSRHSVPPFVAGAPPGMFVYRLSGDGKVVGPRLGGEFLPPGGSLGAVIFPPGLRYGFSLSL